MNVESECSKRERARHLQAQMRAELGTGAEIYCPVERQVSARGRILHKITAIVRDFSSAQFGYSDRALWLRKHGEEAMSEIGRAVSASGARRKDSDARKRFE
jgi:hypothetical protein